MIIVLLINYLTQLNEKNFIEKAKQSFSWNWNTNESIEQEIFILYESLIHCYIEEILNRKLKYVYPRNS